MGWAEVPLRGIFLSGHIEASLVMTDTSAAADKSRGEKRLKQAGDVSGSIQLLAEPEHTQFGDVVKRLPKMTYLAVQIVKCNNLPPRKADGTSDPYVSVVWAATSQQTRVVRSTRAPLYDETLYFPTNLNRITSEDLAAKGDIVVYVLHHTPIAPEDIGFARLPLAKITGAPVHRIEDGTAVVRTRVYDEKALRLKQQGASESRGEIQLRAYFTPTLPEEVTLSETASGSNDLDGPLEARDCR